MQAVSIRVCPQWKAVMMIQMATWQRCHSHVRLRLEVTARPTCHRSELRLGCCCGTFVQSTVVTVVVTVFHELMVMGMKDKGLYRRLVVVVVCGRTLEVNMQNRNLALIVMGQLCAQQDRFAIST